jgi:DNA-binding HxlR family transcriptional regulator
MTIGNRKPVRGSTRGRPIMALLDMLGQRWTLRILWELRDGPLTFRGLRGRCDAVSPTVLNARLKALREVELVALDDAGFGLTPRAVELSAILSHLDALANSWASPAP